MSDTRSRSKKEQILLRTPEGVFDHYGREEAEYEALQEKISAVFHGFGYENLRTPAIEFFDVFSREVGTTPSNELFKFTDRDGHTLVLRPDFTPSVARCTARYYLQEKEPLRFCYQGSVFANAGNLQGKRKESTETGCELINDASVEADAEMIAMLVRALRSSGLSQFQVTVGNVAYFKGLCEAAGVDEDTEEELRECLSGKNYYAARSLLQESNVLPLYQGQFLKLTTFMKNDEDLRQVQQSAPNSQSAAALERLIRLYALLKLYGVEQYVSFDLSLLSKYHYYTGIIFNAYTYGVGDVIASGGRYDTLLAHFGKDAPAIGFAVRLDMLMEALHAQNIPVETKPAPAVLRYTQEDFAEKLQEADARRARGEHVVLEKIER